MCAVTSQSNKPLQAQHPHLAIQLMQPYVVGQKWLPSGLT